MCRNIKSYCEEHLAYFREEIEKCEEFRDKATCMSVRTNKFKNVKRVTICDECRTVPTMDKETFESAGDLSHAHVRELEPNDSASVIDREKGLGPLPNFETADENAKSSFAINDWVESITVEAKPKSVVNARDVAAAHHHQQEAQGELQR